MNEQARIVDCPPGLHSVGCCATCVHSGHDQDGLYWCHRFLERLDVAEGDETYPHGVRPEHRCDEFAKNPNREVRP